MRTRNSDKIYFQVCQCKHRCWVRVSCVPYCCVRWRVCAFSPPLVLAATILPPRAHAEISVSSPGSLLIVAPIHVHARVNVFVYVRVCVRARVRVCVRVCVCLLANVRACVSVIELWDTNVSFLIPWHKPRVWKGVIIGKRARVQVATQACATLYLHIHTVLYCSKRIHFTQS